MNVSSESQPSVGQYFDDVGKSHDAKFYSSLRQMLFNYIAQYPHQEVDVFKYLLGGLVLVVDAVAIHKALRWEFRNGISSDLVNMAKSGFVTLLAPNVIDDEVAKYAEDIGRDCGVRREDVLKRYIETIRPCLQLVEVSDSLVLREVQAHIRDVKDAPYLAVLFERKAVEIVSEDLDVKEYPQRVESYTVKEACVLNVVYRKQYVVLYVNVLNAGILLGLLAVLIKVIWALRRYIVGGGLIVAGVLLLMRCFAKERFDEVMAKIQEVASETKAQLGMFLEAIQPFLSEYFEECAKRTEEFKQKIGALTMNGTQGISYKSSPPVLTYVGLIKMIMLTMGRRPIREKDICAVFNELGYTTRGRGSLRPGIRRALKDKTTFMRLSNGSYQLMTPLKVEVDPVV